MKTTVLQHVAVAERQGKQPAEMLNEHDLITLAEAVPNDGQIIPAGTVGTIVGVWLPETAFEVEFADPKAIVTLQRNQVRLYERLHR